MRHEICVGSWEASHSALQMLLNTQIFPEELVLDVAMMKGCHAGIVWCREQLAQLSVHADIASRLNRIIDDRALVEMGKLEQDLVYGNATSKEVVTFLGYHQQLPPEEKVPSQLQSSCPPLQPCLFRPPFVLLWLSWNTDCNPVRC